MIWDTIIKNEDGSYIIPSNWIFPYYYEALNILFRIENALRVFVYIILKKELNEKWDDITINTDESSSSTLKAIAKKRIEQDSIFGYIGYDITSPMLYLTSGELIRIITSDGYWKYFKNYFQGSKEIIKNKLDEINNIRNALSHFRPIKIDDIDVIKQNSKHVLLSIESFLIDIISCSKRIPSNTTDEWYKKITSISSDLITLSLTQNDKEDWVKIKLKVKLNILQRSRSPRIYKYFIVSNLITPRIISHMPISSIFHILILKILKIKEIELMKEDIMARGDLLTINNIKAQTIKVEEDGSNHWYVDPSELYITTEKEKCAEFWGKMYTFINNDFISHSNKYPWIPIDIARWDLF